MSGIDYSFRDFHLAILLGEVKDIAFLLFSDSTIKKHFMKPVTKGWNSLQMSKI